MTGKPFYVSMYVCLANFLKTSFKKFARHLSQKAGVLGPISSAITLTREKKKKGRGGRKEEKRKKAMVALLVSIMATFEMSSSS